MDPSSDRKNGNIFLWANLLIYLAAPVRYIGVTQAALCDKLGASAAVANLPTAGYFFASFAPIVFAHLVPHRWERRTLVLSGILATFLLTLVAVALICPVSNPLRIGVVVGQSFALGLLNSVQQMFLLQCLGRGTTAKGRPRALKLAFGLGPVAAVVGSLTAQFILRGGIASLVFPRDFAVLYLIGVPTSAFMAWTCSHFELPPLADEPKTLFFRSMGESFRRFQRSRTLLYLWFAYVLWWSTYNALPNLSLFARHALGREPADFSGVMMAIQFGSKAFAGIGLGFIFQRFGVRATLVVTLSSVGLGLLWAWTVPGYSYLAAFAFMGVGQLGGFYFPNAVLSWSPSATAPRDLAILTLATLAASPTPTVHGLLTDHLGFSASFIFGIVTALAGLVLVFRLPARRPAFELASPEPGGD